MAMSSSTWPGILKKMQVLHPDGIVSSLIHIKRSGFTPQEPLNTKKGNARLLKIKRHLIVQIISKLPWMVGTTAAEQYYPGSPKKVAKLLDHRMNIA
jgi:hypothetical protein